jgi:hypothetical protein
MPLAELIHHCIRLQHCSTGVSGYFSSINLPRKKDFCSGSTEIGRVPVVTAGVNLFFQFVNARYERGATILTSTARTRCSMKATCHRFGPCAT